MGDQLTMGIKDILRDMARKGKSLSTQQTASLIEEGAQKVFDLPIDEKVKGKKAVKRPATGKQGDVRDRIKAKLERKQPVPKSKPKDKGMVK